MSEDIDTGIDAKRGLTLTVEVLEYNNKYWTGIDLSLNEEEDLETVDDVQFYILREGIQEALDKLNDLIRAMENGEDIWDE